MYRVTKATLFCSVCTLIWFVIALAFALGLGIPLSQHMNDSDSGNTSIGSAFVAFPYVPMSDAAQCTAPEKFQVQLKWVVQSQFAGYYAALAKGYYAQENLNVTIVPGGPDADSWTGVLDGTIDATIDWVASAIRQEEKRVVNVAQTFSKSGLVLACRKSTGISSVNDLANKTVGVWFYGNEYPFLTWLDNAQIPYFIISGKGETDNKYPNTDHAVKVTKQGWDVKALTDGSADCVHAMTYNELYDVLKAFPREDLVLFNYDDIGVSILEDGLYMTEETLAMKKDAAARFVRATMAGWLFVRGNPIEAVEILARYSDSLDKTKELYSIYEVLDLLSVTAEMSSAMWHRSLDMIGVSPSGTRTMFTNEVVAVAAFGTGNIAPSTPSPLAGAPSPFAAIAAAIRNDLLPEVKHAIARVKGKHFSNTGAYWQARVEYGVVALTEHMAPLISGIYAYHGLLFQLITETVLTFKSYGKNPMKDVDEEGFADWAAADFLLGYWGAPKRRNKSPYINATTGAFPTPVFIFALEENFEELETLLGDNENVGVEASLQVLYDANYSIAACEGSGKSHYLMPVTGPMPTNVTILDCPSFNDIYFVLGSSPADKRITIVLEYEKTSYKSAAYLQTKFLKYNGLTPSNASTFYPYYNTGSILNTSEIFFLDHPVYVDMTLPDALDLILIWEAIEKTGILDCIGAAHNRIAADAPTMFNNKKAFGHFLNHHNATQHWQVQVNISIETVAPMSVIYGNLPTSSRACRLNNGLEVTF